MIDQCNSNVISLKGYLGHQRTCPKDGLRYEITKPGKMLSFTNIKKQLSMPFVIYADLEAWDRPLDILRKP